MRFLVIFVFTFVLACIQYQHVHAIEPISFAISSIPKLISAGKFLWDLFNESPKEEDTSALVRLQYLNIQNRMSNIQEKLDTILLELPNRVEFNKNLLSMIIKIGRIEDYYNDMVTFNRSHLVNKRKIIYEANQNLNNDGDRPIGLLREIHDLAVATRSYSIINSLRTLIKGYSRTCSTEIDRKSFQQLLQEFLTMLTATKIKVYLILQMAVQVLRIYGDDENLKNEFSTILDTEIAELNRKNIETVKIFKEFMSSASREVWRCDPDEYKDDLTYGELKNVFQKIVVNELDFKIKTRCSGTCESENPRTLARCTTSYEESGYSGMFYVAAATSPKFNGENVCAKQRPCAGKLWNCNAELDVGWKSWVKICRSDNSNTRRYNKLEVRDLWSNSITNNLGKLDCIHSSREANRGVDIAYRCDVCVCTCDDNIDVGNTDVHSERFFYAEAITAETSENYVIIGARLRKQGSLIYVEIQQGKLLEEGLIDKNTVEWTRPRDLYNPAFHKALSWKNKGVELADAEVPSGNVLVGLRLDSEIINDEGRIHLNLISLPFNFISGKLNYDSTEQITKPTFSNSSVKVEGLKVPNDKEKGPIKVFENKYINFSTSDMESDVGQTTLPFIDLQEVTTNTLIPMAGASFYYRRSEGYGGFLALKLKTYDISQHLNPEEGTLIGEEGVKENLKPLAMKDWRIGAFNNEPYVSRIIRKLISNIL